MHLLKDIADNPILTHYVPECLFKQDIITKDDIDKLFERSEEHIENIINAILTK